jgi:hypothetical protein
MDLPGIGGVDKKIVVGVGAAVAAFVGWQYFRARQNAGADVPPADPGFEDAGTLPGVAGAVKPGGDYGLPDGDGSGGGGGSVDDYGFRGTTNSQWTQYASAKLSQDDRWPYSTIVEALGAYLAGRPLTTAQQSIVQAAIAVAGAPPVGYHVVVPGGDVPILVAPAGVTATATAYNAITVRWTAVSGAAKYEVSGSGVTTQTVTGTSASFTGLKDATSYGFQVRAVAAAGHKGPVSSTASASTPRKVSIPANRPKQAPITPVRRPMVVKKAPTPPIQHR